MYLGKQRKLTRWFGFDYKMPGKYFVTICTKNRISDFGEIIDNEMILNDAGEIVKQQWLWLAINFKYIKLDEFIIMPNHIHGIIEIINENYYNDNKIFGLSHNRRERIKGLILGQSHKVGNGRDRSLQDPINSKIKPLPEIIGAFKTTSSKLIHKKNDNFHFQWQKSFHDRVIRNEQEYLNICHYIKQNPINWHNDRNNLINIK